MDPSELDNLDEIQDRLNRSVREETNTEEKLDFIELLREVSRNKSGPIRYDTIRVEARLQGLTESTINRFLDELERDEIIERHGESRYSVLD